MPSIYGHRRAHLNPAEGRELHDALRDVSPAEAEEFKENVLSPAEIERRKNRKATPTPVRSEVLMSDTNLRASLIRLAHANPSLRADILPLVMKEATTTPAPKKDDVGGAKAASLRTAAIRFAYENPALRKVVLAALKEADEGSPEADKGALKEDADPASHDQNLASTWEKTAAGPDAMGRGWKEKDDGGKHRWVWAGRSEEPAFTVTEQSTPAGLIYKFQILMPDGNIFQAFGQKTEKEHWFKRAAQLYKAWGSAAGFYLFSQPEKWSRLASGPKVAADHDYSPERGEVGGVRDDLIAALEKNGIQAKDDVSSNVLYIGDAKYAIHGPWLEGKGLGGRGKWIQKPTRAAWLAEAVKVLSKLAKK